jgi:hypothetical protein
VGGKKHKKKEGDAFQGMGVVYSWPSLLNSSGDSLNQYHDLGINTMIY